MHAANVILACSTVVKADIWSELNRTVHGRLHAAAPFSLPCFSTYSGVANTADPVACADIQSHYTSSDFRAQFYNGFMNNQDEICVSNSTDQCILNNANPLDAAAFNNRTCSQGSVSRYYIDIQSVEDVQAAYNFSQKTGIKLSIKNSGHDYLGRSSLQGSLAIWTRNLRGIRRDKEFIPTGCKDIEPIDTISTAAGVNSDETYKFADAENVTFIGGYATTVGVSGGWAQGGGHSVLSPVYGLGIDRTVQFQIVTPDRHLRTANVCQNPDLFWALKGGGGGTFGVVLEVTHRVDPVVPLAVAYIRYTPTAGNIATWLRILVENGLPWAQQGWGGHLVSSNLISVTPLLNLSEAELAMAPAADFARANNGSVVIEMLPSWYAFYTKYIISNQVPVAGARILGTRLLSTVLFATAEGRQKVVDFLNYLVSIGMSPYIPADSPFLFPWRCNSTSATAAWRSSLWEVGFGVNLGWNSTGSQRRTAIQTLQDLDARARELTPDGGGAYMNEASPWTQNWRQDWWGDENYAALLSIKKRYDPLGLLRCWKCVGFEEGDDGFECYAGLG
ncbi:isoamyl alcohol [Phlyctema vagabunda]|uniref:Isoamyl alcohol n=1 Tax=Phlyctema vagabunda TaxID=108571 RepID=A0ABR4PT41_9HELO